MDVGLVKPQRGRITQTGNICSERSWDKGNFFQRGHQKVPHPFGWDSMGKAGNPTDSSIPILEIPIHFPPLGRAGIPNPLSDKATCPSWNLGSNFFGGQEVTGKPPDLEFSGHVRDPAFN